MKHPRIENFHSPGTYTIISLRDYLAAHAPEVPDWFVYFTEPRDYPPLPDLADICDPDQRALAENWLGDPCYDLPESLRDFAEKAKAHWKAEAQWKYRNKFARLVQWRYAFADAMLAEQDVARNWREHHVWEGGAK